MPIIPLGYELEIFLVQRRPNANMMSINITEEIDLEKVGDILRRYSTRRTFRNPFPTMGDDMWILAFSRGNDHVNMVVGGNTNVVYRCGTDTIMYEIIDWESLMHELEGLFFDYLVYETCEREQDYYDYLVHEAYTIEQDFSEFLISEPLINSLDCGSIEWVFVRVDNYKVHTRKINNTDYRVAAHPNFSLEFFDGVEWRIVPPHPDDRSYFLGSLRIVGTTNLVHSLNEFHPIPAADLFRLRRTIHIHNILGGSQHELVVEFSFV